MKSIILVGLLLIVTGAVITGFTLRSNLTKQNARFNVRDLAGHGLSIIGSSEPTYMELVSNLLQGKSDPIVETLAPFSIFIKNTTKHTVVACVLKWEMITPKGKTLTFRREYTNLLGLMDRDISEVKEGLLIKPSGTWFFTPSYLPVYQGGETGSETAKDQPEVIAELNRLLSELSQSTSITVSLDGAFFDDGTFVGPDNTDFFAKVEAMRNGRRDAFLTIVNDRKQGKTDKEIFNHVEELATAKVDFGRAPTPTDYYSRFKKETAAELLRIKVLEGENRTVLRAQAKMQKPWPQLRKL